MTFNALLLIVSILGLTPGTSPAGRPAAEAPAGRRDHAVRIEPFAEGAVFPLRTAPERVTDIALEEGESLVSVAAGDTARWVIGDTGSGTGAQRRPHVLVKPIAPGLRTNLLIMTDRRVYRLLLESGPLPADAGLSWTYAHDPLMAIARSDAPASRAPVPFETIRFDYSIAGDRPPWRPVRVFDDGRQVYIEFPAGLASSEAPPLFVRGEGGNLELVNYRLRGRFYVVDRLFDRAELRLGEGTQQVVRIVRTASAPVRARRPR